MFYSQYLFAIGVLSYLDLDDFYHFDTTCARHVPRNGGARFRHTLGGAVLRVAFPQSLLPSLNDVAGSREIRLTNLQVDDAFPLRFERARFGQYLKCRLGSEAGHSFNKFH